MRTYFTSDTHFNCPALVANTRSWTTPADHDTYLAECINEVVGAKDRLVIVGDFCNGQPQKWRNMLKCRNIWLVLGNHDKPSLMKACFGVNNTRESLMVKLGASRVFCSHYPHAHWDRSHYGVFHAYGHVHGQREDELDRFYPQRRSVDVGVDNAVKFYGKPCPFPEEWFTEVLASRTGHDTITKDRKWKMRDFGSDE